MSSDRKRRAAVIAAMFLLVVSQWMYCMLMFSAVRDTFMLCAELAFFFVFYLLLLFDLPPVVTGLTAIAGCAVFCVVYLLTQFDNQMYHFLPLIYLPALLFPVAQKAAWRNVDGFVCLTMRVLCCQLIPIAQILAVFFVQKSIQLHLNFSAVIGIVFVAVVMLLLCALYLVVAFSAKRMTNAKKQAELRRMRFFFDFAIIPMLLTIPMCVQFSETVVINNAMILWLLNLFVLYEQKNPLVCTFASRFKKRFDVFLASDDA